MSINHIDAISKLYYQQYVLTQILVNFWILYIGMLTKLNKIMFKSAVEIYNK